MQDLVPCPDDHCFLTSEHAGVLHVSSTRFELWFWQLSRDGNLHGSGMSHTTTASPKPSFRAPWSMGDTVVGRGNAGWTTQKVDIPAHAKMRTRASFGKDWKRISAESSLICPQRPNRSRDCTESIWIWLAIVLCVMHKPDQTVCLYVHRMRTRILLDLCASGHKCKRSFCSQM